MLSQLTLHVNEMQCYNFGIINWWQFITENACAELHCNRLCCDLRRYDYVPLHLVYRSPYSNLSYPGSLVPTRVRILDMFITKNCIHTAVLDLKIEVMLILLSLSIVQLVGKVQSHYSNPFPELRYHLATKW